MVGSRKRWPDRKSELLLTIKAYLTVRFRMSAYLAGGRLHKCCAFFTKVIMKYMHSTSVCIYIFLPWKVSCFSRHSIFQCAPSLRPGYTAMKPPVATTSRQQWRVVQLTCESVNKVSPLFSNVLPAVIRRPVLVIRLASGLPGPTLSVELEREIPKAWDGESDSCQGTLGTDY